MNIVDAIKSNRPFYRKSWTNRSPITFEEVKTLSREALTADDWEVEQIEVSVTDTQFNEAWRSVVSLINDGVSPEYIKEVLRQELKLDTRGGNK